MPGSPHPSASLVVAAEFEGKWRAVKGYRFLNEGPGDLRVAPVAVPESDRLTPERVQRIKDLATLGLDESADRQAIESAFRRLVRVHHPDRFSRQSPEAVEAASRSFRALRSAFDRLS